MSTALTLARPYARAAFELARTGKSLADWSSKLGFAAQVARDPKVAGLIGNPHVAAKEMVSLFLPQGEAVDSAFGQFLGAMAGNRRLDVLPEVAAQFEQHKRDEERVLRVTVRSAVALDATAADALKASLKKRFDREIEMQNTVEPELLGGAIIDAGDTVIDGSVRGRLAKLQAGLMQ